MAKWTGMSSFALCIGIGREGRSRKSRRWLLRRIVDLVAEAGVVVGTREAAAAVVAVVVAVVVVVVVVVTAVAVGVAVVSGETERVIRTTMSWRSEDEDEGLKTHPVKAVPMQVRTAKLRTHAEMLEATAVATADGEHAAGHARAWWRVALYLELDSRTWSIFASRTPSSA
jgi:hypothetical protein